MPCILYAMYSLCNAMQCVLYAMQPQCTETSVHERIFTLFYYLLLGTRYLVPGTWYLATTSIAACMICYIHRNMHSHLVHRLNEIKIIINIGLHQLGRRKMYIYESVRILINSILLLLYSTL